MPQLTVTRTINILKTVGLTTESSNIICPNVLSLITCRKSNSREPIWPWPYITHSSIYTYSGATQGVWTLLPPSFVFPLVAVCSWLSCCVTFRSARPFVCPLRFRQIHVLAPSACTKVIRDTLCPGRFLLLRTDITSIVITSRLRWLIY